MARGLRVWFPKATYHITARGNRREKIFYDAFDYQYYLNLAAECMEKTPFFLHAYCLMPNHVHLLLETIDHPPGVIIKEIHMNYAIHFNKRYDLSGHVFQGRYHSRLILSEDYFLKVSRYIHLNPVEAEMVKNPDEYIWSSFSDYVTGEKRHGVHISKDRTLNLFKNPNEPKIHQYLTYVMGTVPHHVNTLKR